jgi:hypothetical protein
MENPQYSNACGGLGVTRLRQRRTSDSSSVALILSTQDGGASAYERRLRSKFGLNPLATGRYRAARAATRYSASRAARRTAPVRRPRARNSRFVDSTTAARSRKVRPVSQEVVLRLDRAVAEDLAARLHDTDGPNAVGGVVAAVSAIEAEGFDALLHELDHALGRTCVSGCDRSPRASPLSR